MCCRSMTRCPGAKCVVDQQRQSSHLLNFLLLFNFFALLWILRFMQVGSLLLTGFSSFQVCRWLLTTLLPTLPPPGRRKEEGKWLWERQQPFCSPVQRKSSACRWLQRLPSQCCPFWKSWGDRGKMLFNEYFRVEVTEPAWLQHSCEGSS